MDRRSDHEVPGASATVGGRAGRTIVMVTAALSILAGLECGPSRSHASRKDTSAPLITAEPLPRFERGPKADARWSWPAAAHFDATVSRVRGGAEPIRLVHGRLIQLQDDDREVVDGVVLSIAPEGDSFDLAVELAETRDAYDSAWFASRAGWTLTRGSFDEAQAGTPLVFTRGSATMLIEPTYVSAGVEPARTQLDDWAYVAALLASDAPIYDDEPAREGSNVEKDLKAALAAGDNARALAIYRTWRPVGRCSMDTYPAEVAREYAELCYRIGNLGCFLQLQVRIMGDQFDRVAYSSYGEAAHSTEAERLIEAGLDVDRFLLGLTLRYSGVSRLGELGPWRLARSIKEAGRADSVVPVLAQWAADPDIDEYNQVRAVQVLAYLDKDDAIEEDELPDIALMWLRQHRERDR